MIVHEIINTEIRPLGVNDTVSFALIKMDLLSVTRFPVVNETNHLIGMIELNTLVDAPSESMDIDTLELKEPVFIQQSSHIFEAARLMLSHELYILPIVDEEMRFLGMIRKKEVLNALGEIFNLSAFGSVITVGVDQVDFSLADLVRIVEEEGAKILGIAVQQPGSESDMYYISFKLNISESSTVSSALRRFGYLVTSEANSIDLEADYTDRANELLRYLDI